MPTLRTVTLGCKVNQYETEYVREGLARLGYEEAPVDQPADLCVVNTCTVTVEGDAKSRKIIRQLGRQNPGAEIIVMGCCATRAADQVAELPGVTEVVTDKRSLPDLLARRGLVDVPAGIFTFAHHHRAFVKVQDGCAMKCSYCIIPNVRPVLSSRRPREVLDEIRRLVDHGYREIVLTGIHLGHYGVDAEAVPVFAPPGTVPIFAQRKWDCPLPAQRLGNLAELLRQIVELDGEFRVRLSSLEAAEATPELIQVMSAHSDRICPHLHLSMQSGSNSVLKRMRRRWPAERFLERCQEVAAALDQPALTTDVIVGFPGETEADFLATCCAAEQVGFSKLHIFRFSPREGTPAAEMPARVPSRVQQRRADELATIGERLRKRFYDSLGGRQLQVLVEASSPDHPGRLLGTSDRYTPMELDGNEGLVGRLVRVVAGRVVHGRICGSGR